MGLYKSECPLNLQLTNEAVTFQSGQKPRRPVKGEEMSSNIAKGCWVAKLVSGEYQTVRILRFDSSPSVW